jgi:hypothetical protein
MTKRPFSNYKSAITDPDYFDGRQDLVRDILESPLDLRILMGGRRLGKTSALHALEWSMLNPGAGTFGACFPVYINLKKERPLDLENLFYILIFRLRDAVVRWRRLGWQNLRDTYLEFLSQVAGAEAQLGPFLKLKVENPDSSRRLNKEVFERALWMAIEDLRERNRHGVCFLLDEGDYFVSKAWADEAFSYLRALKDASDPMSPFIGLVLSGYRGVKNYKQRIGSALYNIGANVWLCTLSKSETLSIIGRRTSLEGRTLAEDEIQCVLKFGGGHPFLTQQTITYLIDHPGQVDAGVSKLIGIHKQDFSDWWNSSGRPDGLNEADRSVYRALLKRNSATVTTIADATRLSEFEAFDCLEALAGTGVVQREDETTFRLGASLFSEWVLHSE